MVCQRGIRGTMKNASEPPFGRPWADVASLSFPMDARMASIAGGAFLPQRRRSLLVIWPTPMGGVSFFCVLDPCFQAPIDLSKKVTKSLSLFFFWKQGQNREIGRFWPTLLEFSGHFCEGVLFFCEDLVKKYVGQRSFSSHVKIIFCRCEDFTRGHFLHSKKFYFTGMRLYRREKEGQADEGTSLFVFVFALFWSLYLIFITF